MTLKLNFLDRRVPNTLEGPLMSRIKIFACLIIFIGIGCQNASADDARAIAEKAFQRGRGFGDERLTAVTYLINAKNDTVIRRTKNLTLERANGEDYNLIQFLEPADVRGTSLLTHQNPNGDDEQWLYLPELRRVKKISSKNKSGAFMGSEFAYEDISGNSIGKYEYKKLGEAVLGGDACDLLEKTPLYQNSGYTKIKIWVSKSKHVVIRQEMTDRKNTLLKVETFEGFKEYSNGTMLAQRISIENVQTNKKSILEFTARELKVGLKESDFTTESMERLLK